LVKLVAGTLLVCELAAAIILLDPSSRVLPDSFQFIRQQISIPFWPWTTVSPTPEETAVQQPTSLPAPTLPASETASACRLVWAEYPSEELAGKNRSMVWEEVVMEQVAVSEMTARQFYDEVLEHNPDLVRDGYEFKKGKTYLLPKCE
jgi:hypothetical protein